MSTESSPSPEPAQPKESLTDKAANKAQSSFNSWYYGPIIGDLINVYNDSIKNYPKAMGIAHVAVFGLIGVLILVNWLTPKSPAPLPSQSHAAAATPGLKGDVSRSQVVNTPAVKKNLPPIKVTFRNSQIGKGVVIQIAGDKGAKALLVNLHIQGTFLSKSKLITIQPGFTTEVGWSELDNYIVRQGHTITLSVAGYDGMSVVAR